MSQTSVLEPDAGAPAVSGVLKTPGNSQEIEVEQEELTGKTINDTYKVLKLLDSGGMGEVYLARQINLDQKVAIKRLYRHYYQNDSVVSRFLNEAASYVRITHPNAVKIHDLLNVDGQLCIIMEFVEGRTLTHYLDNHRQFTRDQILSILEQLADVLGTAHKAGIIHRDLKGENIMLQETMPGRYHIKVLDFGIAKFLNKDDGHRTMAGYVLGTPEFMSPEQARGEEDVDGRTDIYAFGVLLYYILTQHLPFVSASKLSVLNMQVHDPLPPVSEWSPVVPPVDLDLASMVFKCMAKKREDRYQTFQEVLEDLSLLSRDKPLKYARQLESVSDDPQGSGLQPKEKAEVPVESKPKEAVESKPKKAEKKPKEVRKLAPVVTDELSLEVELDDDEAALGGLELGDDEVGSELPDELSADFAIEMGDEEIADDFELGLGDMADEPGELGLDGDLGEEELPDEMPPKASKGHGGVVVAVVVILLLIGGGFFFLKSGQSSDEPASVSKDISPTNIPVEQNTDIQPESKPVEDVSGAAALAGAEPQDVQEELPPPKPEPVAPSNAVQLSMIQRGIGLSVMETFEEMLSKAELKAAKKLQPRMNDYAAYYSENDQERQADLNELFQLYSDMVARAEKISRGNDCEKINDIINQGELETATGMKAYLTKLKDSCEHKRYSAPTTVD